MSEELFQRVIQVLSTYSGRDKAIRTLYFSLVLLSTRLKGRRAEFAENLLKFAKQLSQARLVTRQLSHLQLFNATRKLPASLWFSLQTAYRESFPLSDYREKLEISAPPAQPNSASYNGVHFFNLTPDSEQPSTSFSIAGWPRFLSDLLLHAGDDTRSATCQLVDEVLSAAVTTLYTLNSVVEFVAWIADAKLVALDAKRWFRYTLNCWICALTVSVVRLARRVTLIGWRSKRSWSDRLALVGCAADLIAGLNMLPSVKLRWRNNGKLSLAQSASLSLIASAIGFYNNF